jgi:hypothetical protein
MPNLTAGPIHTAVLAVAETFARWHRKWIRKEFRCDQRHRRELRSKAARGTEAGAKQLPDLDDGARDWPS